MLGATIAAQALGFAGLRQLPTEQQGPRPAGVRAATTDMPEPEARADRVVRDPPARAEQS